MNKQRLLKIADFLEKQVPAKQFDLSTWCSAEGVSRLCDPKKRTCGTTACILGWTPTCFPRSAFKLKPISEWTYVLEPVYTNKKGSHEGFWAGVEFYGVTHDEAVYLFDPDYYPATHKNRMDAVRRIRRFVESNGANAKRYLKIYNTSY